MNVIAPLPFRPNDWVARSKNHQTIAKVKSIYRDRDEILFDLVLYDINGNKIGRASPAMGGPRTFEPCCSIDGWDRISEPDFPLSLKWVDEGDGKIVGRYIAGNILPSANYIPRQKRATNGTMFGSVKNDRYRRALERIAAGHNDPMTLAKETLGT